jgi:hypothetical protein
MAAPDPWTKYKKGPPFGEPFPKLRCIPAYFSEAQKRWIRLQASSSLAFEVA